MKRIFLLLLTNLGIMVLLSLSVHAFGLNHYIQSAGLNLPLLLGFASVIGFGGSFISLLISKWMAKMSTGAKTIAPNSPATEEESWLLNTVQRLDQTAQLPMPEVAIYEGAPNAFATGAFKNSALVAVSTGLLRGMSRSEVEAVLAHELAHVANGDMVTQTLLQGMVNTFSVFLARVVGFFVDQLLQGNRESNDENRSQGMGYYITVFVVEIVLTALGSLVVLWHSRSREYRADEGAAKLLGTPTPMVQALEALGRLGSQPLPKEMKALGISEGRAAGHNLPSPSKDSLWATHPSLANRIARLKGF